MKTIVEEFEQLSLRQMSQVQMESIKLDILAKHIDNIEKTLKYLVDQKVEEKYGKLIR